MLNDIGNIFDVYADMLRVRVIQRLSNHVFTLTLTRQVRTQRIPEAIGREVDWQAGAFTGDVGCF
ncbi:hypothetical protein D3C84_1002870 [compost metagenome]